MAVQRVSLGQIANLNPHTVQCIPFQTLICCRIKVNNHRNEKENHGTLNLVSLLNTCNNISHLQMGPMTLCSPP